MGTKHELGKADSLMNQTLDDFKKINLKVGRARRVMHSFTNYKNKWKGQGKIDVAADVLNAASVAVSPVAAAVAMTGGAAALVAGGPAFGAAMAVVGIVLAAKSAYSNRDAAHEKLTPYVYSLIDDAAPQSPGDFKDLAAASYSLLVDGAAQLQMMEQKLKEKSDGYTRFETDYRKAIVYWLGECKNFNPNFKNPRVKMDIGDELKAREFGWEKAEAMWKAATEANGALFEYLRRLSHYANYLQAPDIFAAHLRGEKTVPTSFNNFQAVKDIRAALLSLAETRETAIRNHDEFTKRDIVVKALT